MTKQKKQELKSQLTPYEEMCIQDMIEMYGMTRQQAIESLQKLRAYGV